MSNKFGIFTEKIKKSKVTRIFKSGQGELRTNLTSI